MKKLKSYSKRARELEPLKEGQLILASMIARAYLNSKEPQGLTNHSIDKLNENFKK
jgi:hypothetical protein